MHSSPHLVGASRKCSVLLAALACTGMATAQFTPISGAQTGTLTPGVYHVTGALSVPAGQTLTLSPGVIIKFVGTYQFVVAGTLISNGTAANPVIFTDDDDDSAGGDTNGNGASVGSAGAWYNIAFQTNSDASALTHTEVRYAGYANYNAIDLSQADIALGQCTIRDCGADALDLSGNSYPTVTGCSMLNNGSRAFEGVPIHAVPAITNNTATGNGLNAVLITSGTVSSNLMLDTSSMVDGAFMMASALTVQAGTTLTLAPGVVIKFVGTQQAVINGTLLGNGTAANPVIFTDDDDDSAGGDTNRDGASTGSPGAYYNVHFASTSDASALTHTEVRYAGYANYTAVDLNQADIALDQCAIRDCGADALDLSNNSHPTVTECTFTDNDGRSVDDVRIDAVSGFTNNTATGNDQNCLRITIGTVSGQLTLGTQSMLAGAFILSNTLSVTGTGDLTVEQGVIFKMAGTQQVVITGVADFRGTAYEPIVFTDDADDSIGGDSNNDGPSTGSAGAWYNIVVQSTASVSAENMLVRYAGYAGYSAVQAQSPNFTMRAVRVDSAGADGFRLDAANGPLTNLVAWDCGGRGIHLVGGQFDLLHATSAGNGTDGIRAEAAWTGMVVNSNSYHNSTNLSGLTTSEVIGTNGGLTGGTLNIDQDPQFVDLVGGDLHLGPTSPCLGAADLPSAILTAKDHDENSRVLDHSLTGALAPDMGAYERGNWHMAVYVTPRPGETVFLLMEGPPGDSFLGFGLMDGAAMIAPYGIVLAGQPGGTLSLVYPFSVPVGTPMPLAVPNVPWIVGTIIGLQTMTTPSGSLFVGNFSELYRVLVRP